MRLRILLLFSLLAFGASEKLMAQAYKGVKGKADTFWSRSQKFGFGFRFGPNVTLATVTDKFDKPEFGTLPKAGYSIAGVMTMPLKEDYFFYTDLGYMRSGRIMKILDVDWKTDFTYHFLTSSMGLTKTINLRWMKNIPGEVFLSVGPNINYMMSGSGKLITQGNNSAFDLEFNNYDSGQWGDFRRNFVNKANRFLFGINFGIGAEAPLSAKQKLFAEFRFSWGHTNLGTRETTNKLEIVSYKDTMFCSLKTFSMNLIYTYDYDRRKSKQGKSTEKPSSGKNRRR